MKAFDIKWHEEGLKNWKVNYFRQEARINEELDQLRKNYERIAFYELQIKTAKDKGKTSFDSERFMKQKGSK